MKKLNPAQHLALSHYLNTYKDNADFETNLNHVINNDRDDIYPCELYEDIWPETLANEIKDLAKKIENLINTYVFDAILP